MSVLSVTADLPQPAGPADEATALQIGGLVNMHDHLRAFLPTGRSGDGADLAQVITSSNAAQAAAGPAEYRALTAFGAARQAAAGVTTVVDHVYPLHRPGLLEAVVAGHADVGIRGHVALGIMTRGRDDLVTSVADVVALAERAADDLLPADRLYLAPVSLRQNAPEDYEAAASAADRLGVGLYTHIAETQAEVRQCLEQTGLTPVGLLHRSGFLRPGTVLVHAIELTDADIALIADSGAAVVYCPTNHLKLAKGFARIPDLLSAGVPLTLGIDGMSDLFTEMRQAAYIQGQRAATPGVLPTATAFAMATSVPSRILGLDHRAGGDEVLVSTATAAMQPLFDPLWALVHRAGPAQIQSVRVDGEVILSGGVHTRIDLPALTEEVTDITRRLSGAADLTQA